MVSSIVNLRTRCTIFWTKTFDISSWFITYNSTSLCWLWWKNSYSAYPTLKNDSHTPRNTVSSMVNVCIRYVIFWTKRVIFSQCEISPVGFITCNAISLCCLQKGGQIIIWWINSCCSFLMLHKAHTHSHGELFYYIMKELRPGVLISRWKLTPTQHEIWCHR